MNGASGISEKTMVLGGNNLYFDNYRLMLLDIQLNFYLFNRY
jgi:hypothetical protein